MTDNYNWSQGQFSGQWANPTRDHADHKCTQPNVIWTKEYHGSIKTEPVEQATSVYAETKNWGDLRVQVEENSGCRKSEFTGYHLLRGSGTMKLSFLADTLEGQGPMHIRGVLMRKNPVHRGSTIDRVCGKHVGEVAKDTEMHVLQTTSGPGEQWYFSTGGSRKSISFNVGEANCHGQLKGSITLKIMCTDSCKTGEQDAPPPDEGKEMLLVLTLESEISRSIVARCSFTVWPKTRMEKRDLLKLRRNMKGNEAEYQIKHRHDLQKQKSELAKSKLQKMVRLARNVGWQYDDIISIVNKELEIQ